MSWCQAYPRVIPYSEIISSQHVLEKSSEIKNVLFITYSSDGIVSPYVFIATYLISVMHESQGTRNTMI